MDSATQCKLCGNLSDVTPDVNWCDRCNNPVELTRQLHDAFASGVRVASFPSITLRSLISLISIDHYVDAFSGSIHLETFTNIHQSELCLQTGGDGVLADADVGAELDDVLASIDVEAAGQQDAFSEVITRLWHFQDDMPLELLQQCVSDFTWRWSCCSSV